MILIFYRLTVCVTLKIRKIYKQNDGLMQNKYNSCANALELRFFCTILYIGIVIFPHIDNIPKMLGFDAFFVVSLNKPLNKQWSYWWFDIPGRSCVATAMSHVCVFVWISRDISQQYLGFGAEKNNTVQGKYFNTYFITYRALQQKTAPPKIKWYLYTQMN